VDYYADFFGLFLRSALWAVVTQDGATSVDVAAPAYAAHGQIGRGLDPKCWIKPDGSVLAHRAHLRQDRPTLLLQ